jgi:hypothetical protein
MVPYPAFTKHPEDLRWGLKASSILDTILCSNGSWRYYSFHPNRFPNVDLGMLDHGTGDELLIFIDSRNGCLIKGFDHESPMSPHARETFETWPGVFDEAPTELLTYLDDPDFRKTETTFCIWRRKRDQVWWQGEIEECEGREWSSYLLNNIPLDAESYLNWAREYYNREFAEEPVVQIFASCAVNQTSVLSINPKADLEIVKRQLAAMDVQLV